jgi:hypothetical protein
MPGRRMCFSPIWSSCFNRIKTCAIGHGSASRVVRALGIVSPVNLCDWAWLCRHCGVPLALCHLCEPVAAALTVVPRGHGG